MQTAGFIYARSDSNRLPNKILSHFGHRRLIDIIIERARLCDLDEIYLLTTKRPIDDVLAEYCKSRDVRVFRGCYEDLTLRTMEAIESFSVKRFLRINGDSPFLSPTLINYTLRESNGQKFASNLIERTFPYGVSIELIDSDWYHDCCRNSEKYSDKEHLTLSLYRDELLAQAVSIKQNYDWSKKRLTIDTIEDYQEFQKVLSENHLVEYWDLFDSLRPEFSIRK